MNIRQSPRFSMRKVKSKPLCFPGKSLAGLKLPWVIAEEKLFRYYGLHKMWYFMIWYIKYDIQIFMIWYIWYIWYMIYMIWYIKYDIQIFMGLHKIQPVEFATLKCCAICNCIFSLSKYPLSLPSLLISLLSTVLWQEQGYISLTPACPSLC